jgi:molybdopterin biosynthesis enzyme MoaB
MKIGLLTVSDSCYKQPELDKSGPTLKECLQDYLEFSGSTFIVDIVPDELDAIKEWMLRHVSLVDVILTTGGTGFSSRYIGFTDSNCFDNIL